MAYTVSLIMTVIMAFISHFDVNYPRVKNVEILSSKHLTLNPFKILQISDYHNSRHIDIKK